MQGKEGSTKAGLYLNITKTKSMTTEEACNNGGTEIVQHFFLPWFTHQLKWRLQPRNQERHTRAAVEELGRIIRRRGVSLEIKAEIIHSFKIPITMCRCQNWIVKKADRRKKLIHLDLGVRRELYSCSGPTETRTSGS